MPKVSTATRRDKLLQVRVSSELVRDLNIVAQYHDVTMSEYVRSLIRQAVRLERATARVAKASETILENPTKEGFKGVSSIDDKKPRAPRTKKPFELKVPLPDAPPLSPEEEEAYVTNMLDRVSRKEA